MPRTVNLLLGTSPPPPADLRLATIGDTVGVSESISNSRTLSRSVADALGITDVNANSPFVLGVTMPSAATTASINDGEFTGANIINADVNGAIVLSTSNQVLSGKEIRGYIKGSGSPTNVTIRDCRIVCRDDQYRGANLIETSGFGDGLIVENCEITLYANGNDNTRYWLNAIGGSRGNWTFRNNNVHDVNDACVVSSNNVTITGNWFHDFAWRSDDNDHKTGWKPYGTHNDGVQFKSCNTALIKGNLFEMNFSQVSGMVGNPTGPGIDSNNNPNTLVTNHGSIPQGTDYWPNAHGILLQVNGGALTNISVIQNWFKYGTYCIQADVKSGPATGNSFIFQGNRFYVGQTAYNEVVGRLQGGGLGTQSTVTRSMGTGFEDSGPNSLWGTTIYATDDFHPDMNANPAWRGHLIRLVSGSGNSKFDPSITAP